MEGATSSCADERGEGEKNALQHGQPLLLGRKTRSMVKAQMGLEGRIGEWMFKQRKPKSNCFFVA
jgi:hypothetical protein